MSVIKYSKLVRDRIPEIIETSGKTCVTEILPDDEYLRMIDAKLDEELAEYHKDQNIEELADLIEVIYAAAIARGYTIEQLEKVRAEKAEKRSKKNLQLLEQAELIKKQNVIVTKQIDKDAVAQKAPKMNASEREAKMKEVEKLTKK